MRCCHCKYYYCFKMNHHRPLCTLDNKTIFTKYARCNRFLFKTLFWCIIDTLKLIKARKLHKEWLR